MENTDFSVSMKLIENYLFQIDFGEFGDLITDEPEPLGGGEGLNPVRLLAASVANCLDASLVFAIRKYKGDPGDVVASVNGKIARHKKRWRIDSIAVHIQLAQPVENLPHLQRALDQFEGFCIVAQNVRSGIPVAVKVSDSTGKSFHLS